MSQLSISLSQKFISFCNSVKGMAAALLRKCYSLSQYHKAVLACTSEAFFVGVIVSGTWQALILPSEGGEWFRWRAVKGHCFVRWPGTEFILALSRQAHHVVLSFHLLHLTDIAFFSQCFCSDVAMKKHNQPNFPHSMCSYCVSGPFFVTLTIF